ncbi:MAG TPA: Uma2 family endonuclease [Panacibacter sp.]|nr:Uma2 family endonuclease [Panacibacter sp.]
MASAVQILPHYYYEDWLGWEGQWELIYGIPYAMSPAPVPKHQIIANAIGVEFGVALKKCKHCKAMQPIDYKVADDIIVQPDLLIVCKKIEKKYLDFPPVLLAEILSPSTQLKDRHTKFQIYQSQGVKYYLIVSPDTEEIEVYELENNEYKLAQKGNSFSYNFSFEEDCNADINFAEIWK